MADSLTKMEIPEFVPRKGRNLEVVSERQEAQNSGLTADALIREAERLKQKEQELQQVMTVIRTALKVVGAKAASMLSMLFASGMFVWSVMDPSWARTGASCLFAVIVFLPALYADASRNQS